MPLDIIKINNILYHRLLQKKEVAILFIILKTAVRVCHCEQSEAISQFYPEIATHPSGVRNDMFLFTFSF